MPQRVELMPAAGQEVTARLEVLRTYVASVQSLIRDRLERRETRQRQILDLEHVRWRRAVVENRERPVEPFEYAIEFDAHLER